MKEDVIKNEKYDGNNSPSKTKKNNSSYCRSSSISFCGHLVLFLDWQRTVFVDYTIFLTNTYISYKIDF